MESYKGYEVWLTSTATEFFTTVIKDGRKLYSSGGFPSELLAYFDSFNFIDRLDKKN